MTADVRVELARDYLEAHSRDVAWLPPSALAREVTELHTHLAAVLAVLDARPAADRPMCCDDIDPETGEQFGVEVEA